jgi:hypothetical protein
MKNCITCMFTLSLASAVAGCSRDPLSPIISPSADSIAFRGNYSSANIGPFDSFAADQLVKLNWYTGLSSEPPFLPFTQVRAYMSSTSPDSGFREIFRRAIGGYDSCVIPTLTNGNAYFFRVATFDSAERLNSLSQPLMTIPGIPEQAGTTIPAGRVGWAEWASSVAWSHNGSQLAFLKTINNRLDLFLFQISTAMTLQLTHYSDQLTDEYRLGDISWSPDDQWLAYCHSPTTTSGGIDYRTWLIPSTGGTSRGITSGRVDAGAAWESSTRLIFTKGTIAPPNIPEFYRVDLADSNRESMLTSDQAIRKYGPSIDTTQALIVFSGSLVGNSNHKYLFTWPLSGGSPQPLTLNKYWHDIQPSWGIDGRTIYFSSSRSGHYEVWSIDRASGQLRQVTRSQTPGFARFSARQSPDGTHMAFLEVESPFSAATLHIITSH